MANKIQKGTLKKLLTVLLTLTLIVNMSALVISARDYGNGRPGSSFPNYGNDNYEYIEINVNGKLAHTVKGPNGDVAWLVAGVYKTPTLTMNGNVLSYVVGNQRGTYTVTLPEGYTVAESTLESSYGGGTNSQSAMYDYAIINISITKVETPEGDIIEIDPEDDIEEITTEEETTEEETTEEETTEEETTEEETTEEETTEEETTEEETTEEETTEEETTEEETTEEETTEEETTEEETTEEETTEEETTEEETTEEETTEEETTEEETTEAETTEEETTEEETTEEETTEEETTEEETTEEETTEEETTEEETTEEVTTEAETTVPYWPPVDTTPVIPVTPPQEPVDSDGTDEIEDEDVPLDSAPETEEIEVTSVETELDEIEDEDVPLSDVPQTGSASAFYLIMTVASVIGLIGVNASKHDKKNR